MAKFIDVIKYEGDNRTFIYRHPSTDFNMGTQLIVHQSQEAVLYKDGVALQSFSSGVYTLDTKNFPILKNVLNIVSGGQSFFHAEVYFVNLTTQLGLKWGTDSKLRLIEPTSGIPIGIGACGTFNLKVTDGRKLLIKVIGTEAGLEQQQIFGSDGYFKGLIISRVKSNLAGIIKKKGVDIFELDEHIDELSEALRTVINDSLDEYGLFMPEFFITTIQMPEDDAAYIKLKEQRAAQFLVVQEQKIKKAQAEAAQEVSVVNAQTQAKTKLIEAEAHATAEVTLGKGHGEALRAQGADYGMESVRMIGVKAAENEGAGGAVIGSMLQAGIGLGVGAHVAKEVATNVDAGLTAWVCTSCGHRGNRGKFCENCGSAKPHVPTVWRCPSCGLAGLTGHFCPACGTKRGN